MKMLVRWWVGAVLGVSLATVRGVAQTVYAPYTFLTVSGDGYTGSNDGPAPGAHFYFPASVVVDSLGNAFVADSRNNTIRKMAPDGTVTTVAGLAGSSGSTDGSGNTARFASPFGVAVDGAGNLYVADTGNHTLRKVSPGGAVTTLAGLAGQPGSADGFGSAARFWNPVELAVDNASNIYLADSGNDVIRKVTPSGEVTTLAGLAGVKGSADGIGNAARFNYPKGIAVNAEGMVYVTDSLNSTIRKVTPQGEVTTLAGLAGHQGWSDGTGNQARFGHLWGLGLDNAGNLYVAGEQTIRRVTPSGVVTTLAGVAGSGDAGPDQPFSARDGTGAGVRFRNAQDVAVAQNGDLYVVDYVDNTIRKGRPAAYTPYTFITLAGDAGHGSRDGMGSLARFNGPYGVAVDSAGNLYVSDENNFTIRKVTPAGMVTTLAGMAGIYGSGDETGNGARFGGCGGSFLGSPPFCLGPEGVAVDGAGNVFVADAWNSTIRKITPDAVVTTLAGRAGQSGVVDGTGSNARFNDPAGLAIDGAGNLYVAERYGGILRKVTPAGLVTTVAGSPFSAGSADGPSNTARFNLPSGVAVDGLGNLYVADSGNHTIRKITAAGDVTTLAGSAGQSGSADGTRSAARFFFPSGVVVDGSGNVYVTERANDTIRKVSPEGVVTTLAGLAGSSGAVDGSGSAARFYTPLNIALDSAGNLYVTDHYYGLIRKVTLAGMVTTLAGFATESWGYQNGIGPTAMFASPYGVAVDNQGIAYVADSENNAIRKITPAGEVTTLAGAADGSYGSEDGNGSAARFDEPVAVAVDQAGNIYVADNNNSTIRRITPEGAVTTLAGSAGDIGSADGTGAAARFYYPYGVAVDDGGNAFVADTYNNTIRKVTPAGVVTTLAGSADYAGSEDGTGSAAHFWAPAGVAVDHDGNVYVADTANDTIRKVTPAGVVTTLAGCAVCRYGSLDGTGNDARFAGPWGIAVDDDGTIYVGGYGDETIRRITSDGVVTTLAGLAGCIGSDDGTGPAARFGGLFYGFSGAQHRGPTGVAVDDAGNVYVADYLNNTIRKGHAELAPPPIVASGPSFHFNGGQFGFNLNGPAGHRVIVEASTNLTSWLPIWTNTLTEGLRFSDPQSGALPRRFYRISTP